MKIPWHWLLSLLPFVVLLLVINGIQTSLWYLLFGSFPPPLFWLIVLTYVSVTKPLWEATLLTYILSLATAGFTAFPLEAFLVYNLAFMLMLMFIRERVFWGGATFFMLMVGVSSATAPFLYWLASRWFDKNPVFIPQVFDWVISALLSMVFSVPIYAICQAIDNVATKDAGAEGHIGPR